VAAAHFTQRLPGPTEAPLAALGVKSEHLTQGPHRRAWPFFPSEVLPVYRSGRVTAVLRMYRLPKFELRSVLKLPCSSDPTGPPRRKARRSASMSTFRPDAVMLEAPIARSTGD
jgi:hypothetical protein